MATITADEHQVRALARSYERSAEQLVTTVRRVRSRLDQTDWQGQAASRMRSRLHRRHVEANRLARELRDLVHHLNRHAAELERAKGELARLERRIRVWAAANPPDPSTPTPDAALITWWPPRHDLGWHTLSRRLRSHGAVF